MTLVDCWIKTNFYLIFFINLFNVFEIVFSPLSEISQTQSAVIGPYTVIGCGTKTGNDTKVSNSVIGDGCTIGSNVSIEGCYIWHNVAIEDGCTLRHAIVCDGVTMKSGAVVEPGVVLSFRVCVLTCTMYNYGLL